MIKKILSIVCTITVIAGLALTPVKETKAAEVVDGSELLSKEVSYSRGEMFLATYGVYLQTGFSEINKAGTGTVSASGTTLAWSDVSRIGVDVLLERNDGDGWSSYRSWSATNNNISYVTLTKTVSVARGYYYRVKSIHSANSDGSSSWTGGLYID